MDLRLSLVTLAISIALAVLFGWWGGRQWDIFRGPRLLPWRMMMLLAGAWAFFMVIHIANLLGVVRSPN